MLKSCTSSNQYPKKNIYQYSKKY